MRTHSDTLVIGQAGEPATLNPLLSTEDPVIGPLLFSYLVSDNAHGRLQPDVAVSVPTQANGGISKDGLRVTYHLRHGIRWQDGASLTSRDCLFTYRAIMNPRNNVASRGGYDRISSVETPDRYTVVVRLKQPYSPITDTFLALDGNYPILPAHLLAGLKNLNEVPFNAHPVGSGPFRLVSWKRGDSMTFDANPRYFRGMPGLKRIVFKFVPNNQTLINELRTGEIDAVLWAPPVLHEQFSGIPGTKLIEAPASGIFTIVFNTASGPTSDLAVRKAIAKAIDVSSIVRNVTRGAFMQKDALRGIFGWAFRPIGGGARYDPAAASDLLDRAGWHRGRNGVREKNGKRLELDLAITKFYAASDGIATIVQQQLAKIGAAVTIRTYAAALYALPAAEGGPIYGGKFALAVWAPLVGIDPDTSALYACDQRPPAGSNVSRICDARIDAYEADGTRSYDPKQRVRDAVAVERELQRDVPQIVLGRALQFIVVPKTFQGLSPSPVTPYVGVWRWRIGAS